MITFAGPALVLGIRRFVALEFAGAWQELPRLGWQANLAMGKITYGLTLRAQKLEIFKAINAYSFANKR